MVKRDVLNQRLSKIDTHLQQIEPLSRCSLKEFQHDRSMQDIAEYNFFQIINHLIDIAQHIVVDEGYGYPKSYGESVDILCDKKILTKKDALLLRNMIGFRNVIAHDYVNLDKKIVYGLLQDGVRDVKRIVGKIVKRFL